MRVISFLLMFYPVYYLTSQFYDEFLFFFVNIRYTYSRWIPRYNVYNGAFGDLNCGLKNTKKLSKKL